MLGDAIKESYILLGVEADNREDAIRKSAQPLLDDGRITAGYVDAIIEILKEIGPYIVITKHVAMPHAPIEKGALAEAMSIVSLKTPVVFGNEDNDPVKYLFCLSAKDGDGHLALMAELVTLLEDEAFFNLLDQTNDPKKVYDYVLAK